MDNYVNYRYRDFQNQSFQNEFRKGEEKKADFTGSRLKSCDFRGTNLAGADFSETAIGQDKQNFQKQIMQMSLHIILGLPLGLLSWFSGRLVLVGCGGGSRKSLWVDYKSIYLDVCLCHSRSHVSKKAFLYIHGANWVNGDLCH